MSTGKNQSRLMAILPFLCVLILTGSAAAQSETGRSMDLKGTDSKGGYSFEDDQVRRGSSVGHGFMNRKREGSGSKSSLHGAGKKYPHHLSGNKSDKTYSHKGPGSGHGYKKSEGSGSKSYSHGKKGKGYGRHQAEGSRSKSYGHGKFGYRGGHGYSADHGHVKNPFRHVLRFRKTLGLTKEQIQKIKDFNFEFKKTRIQAKADHQIAHMELERLVHSATIDENKIRAAGGKIVAAKAKKIMAMVEAKVQLLKLLTVEQRKKMSDMHAAH